MVKDGLVSICCRFHIILNIMFVVFNLLLNRVTYLHGSAYMYDI